MDTLDEFQKKAVLEDNNVILIAGAGAGKTYTVLKKIEYLINNNKCLENQILLISFTNKSVDDLKERLHYKCDVYTFHKLAIKILNYYNVEYKLVSDTYLKYIVNEYFYNLNTLQQNKILKYFSIYNYEYFLESLSYKKLIENITKTIKFFKANNYYEYNKILAKDKLLGSLIYIINKLYNEELLANNYYDFDDIIINATKILKDSFNYKYIIIDEFQDTSIIRFNLINKLRIINNAKIFVVGDDYQSIYHFTGCNLNIFLELQKYIENTKLLKLKYTYRNSQELINIAGSFIMKNNNQIKKELISFKHDSSPIKIVYYINPKKAFLKLYNKIYKDDNDLLILGRNNFDIKRFSNNNVNYMTIHSSKGLEANNVIIINLYNGKYGFPSNIVENKALKEIFSLNENIMYAEERRLFYVALTRARKRVYLLVPLFRKSVFVKEIRKYIK